MIHTHNFITEYQYNSRITMSTGKAAGLSSFFTSNNPRTQPSVKDPKSKLLCQPESKDTLETKLLIIFMNGRKV